MTERIRPGDRSRTLETTGRRPAAHRPSTGWAGTGADRRPSHPGRFVVVVGCERLGRLVSYGLPVGSKVPRNAWIVVECPCGASHMADAIPRARRRGESVEIELEEPTWRKRPGTLARQS